MEALPSVMARMLGGGEGPGAGRSSGAVPVPDTMPCFPSDRFRAAILGAEHTPGANTVAVKIGRAHAQPNILEYEITASLLERTMRQHGYGRDLVEKYKGSAGKPLEPGPLPSRLQPWACHGPAGEAAPGLIDGTAPTMHVAYQGCPVHSSRGRHLGLTTKSNSDQDAFHQRHRSEPWGG